MTTLLTLIAVIAVWLATFVVGVMVANQVKTFGAVMVVRVSDNLFIQSIKWYGFRNTVSAYAKVYSYLVYAAIVDATTTAAEYLVSAGRHIQSVVTTAAGRIADYFNGLMEVLFCLILPRVKASITTAADYLVRAVDSIHNVVTTAAEYFAVEFPETSFFALTVGADDTQYPAGEYLVRDNGTWSNVYLTSYARTLIGQSADVIALTPATVYDGRGTSRVWTVAIA